MGTITRNFANNLTTSGLLKPTAFNNDSFDNVTSVPNGSVEPGDMVFIKKLTASSSATLSFVDGTDGVVLDDTYKEYVFTFKNMHPATDFASFQFNMSIDSGSNYNVTKTSTLFYAFNSEGAYGNETLVYDNQSRDLAQSTAFQSLNAFGVSNASDSGLAGSLSLFNPASTTYVKHFISTCVHDAGSYMNNTYIAGYGNTTSAVNAIRFQMSSGNIDAGDICLYGIA